MNMFRRKFLSDRKILVLVRLIDTTKKFFVFLVLFGLVWNIIPWNALYGKSDTTLEQPMNNEDNQNYHTTTDPNFNYADIDIIDEDMSLRTNNSKTFRKKDGSRVAIIYDDTVHYLENGKYENIDNSFDYDTKNENYNNKKNAFSINMPKYLDENKKIKLTMDKYSISWSVETIDKAEIFVENSENKSTNIKQLSNISQRVVYQGIEKNVDLEYILNGSKVKENIILDRYIKNFELTFKYDLKNLELVEKNGKINFVNENGDEIFNFGDFYAYDSLGETTDSVQISIINVKKDSFKITIKVDEDWLIKASYPVVIDPTISIDNEDENYIDTYVCQAQPNVSFSNNTYMIVSNTSSSSICYGLLAFTLPEDVMNNQITYATLTLHQSSITTVGRTIGLYKNATSFDNNVKWTNRPNSSYEMTDFHIIGSSSIYTFNITEAIREWQSTGIAQTPGFTIKDKEDYGGYLRVKTKEYDDDIYDPAIEIGYLNPAGIKNYWTYNSHDVGEHSTGYVSDFTGLLNILRSDLLYQTDKQSLGQSFAYNIHDKSIDYGYYSGWNTIYNKKISRDEYSEQYFTTDYTGNRVIFYETSTDSRFFSDTEDYINYHLAEDGSNDKLGVCISGGYVIRSGYHTKEIYDEDGYLVSIKNESSDITINIERNGALVTKITDSSGNYIINIYSDNHIIKSRLYTYTSYFLDPYLLEEVDYNYAEIENDMNELTITYKKNYDSSDVMTVDDVVVYRYDSSNRIILTYVPNGENTAYSYESTSNKISTILSSYGEYNFNYSSYDYSHKATTITYQDDKFINYKFDDFGHTVNVLDSEGNVQSFKYMNIYQNEDEYHLNHRLISQTNPQNIRFNPINNGGFEFSELEFEHKWNYYDDTGTTDDLVNNYNYYGDALFGNYSAYIEGNGINTGYFEQDVVLDHGEYTLTGYIKNLTTSSGVCIDIEGVDVGGNRSCAPATGEWEKVVITFILNSDDTNVEILLINQGDGEAFFDNIELSSDFVDNYPNMMENPSFEYSNSSSSIPGWTVSNSFYVSKEYNGFQQDDVYHDILGEYSLKINGSGNQVQSAFSRIFNFTDSFFYIEGKDLMIGAWAKSSGIPTTVTEADVLDGNSRYMRIRVDFTDGSLLNPWDPRYESTVIKSDYIYVDSSIVGWQYVYQSIKLPEVESPDVAFFLINVIFEYKGEGSVYFDGLQVTYDSNCRNFIYHDSTGEIWKSTLSDGSETEYFYSDKDYPSEPIGVKLANGNEMSFDSDNPIQSTSRINNVLTTVNKNQYGQEVSTKIGDDSYFTNYTSYTHLSQFVSSRTNEHGDVTNYETNTLNGLLKAIRNAKSQDTHFLYDNEGKLIKVVSVDDYLDYSSGDEDGFVEYMYDSSDRLWKIILGTGYYYELTYDPQNRIEHIYVNTQKIMDYTYDMDGMYNTNRISEQTYGNGDVLKFNYNDNNQLENIQFKDTEDNTYITEFSYEYDQNNRIAVYNTFQDNSIIKSEYYTYDSSGRLSQVVDNEGNLFQYLYDSEGNLVSLNLLIDGSNVSSNFHYNQCLDTEEGYCSIPSSFYDRTTYSTPTYDLITKDYSYEDSAFHYLNFVLLTTEVFSVCQDLVYYGNTNRISDIIYYINGSIMEYKYHYAYDDLGNIIEEKYYEENSLVLQRNYVYDGLNQLVVEDSRDYNYSESTYSTTNYSRLYTYERGNLIDKRTYLYGQRENSDPVIPPFFQNVTGSLDFYMVFNSTYTFDNIFQLQIGQNPVHTFKYYDAQTLQPILKVSTVKVDTNLNINVEGYYYSRYIASRGTAYEMTFDIIYRVGNPTSVLTVPQEHLHYEYDSEWTDQLIQYDTMDYVNGLPQSSSTVQQYTYDAQGNPVQITHFMFDGVNYEYATLKWNGRDLKEIKIYEDLNEVEIATITYAYNDQGYRIEKKINRTNVGIETISYTLMDSQVIYETNGIYSITYHLDIDLSIISFTYDPDVSVSGNEEEYFYLRNQMGDITHVKDESGETVIHYIYDAYGKMIKTDVFGGNYAIEDINSYTYRGYRYDKEIEWYYLNSRYYDPSISRFISSDGMLGQMGDILSTNMYAYCVNNPVMYSDPSGNFPWLILAALLLFTPIGGTVLQIATSSLSYTGMAITAIWNKDVRADMNAINWNPLNSNEQATLNSNNVSFYKGVPVFRTASGGRSGSFGAIFLTKGSGVDTLRHERGHNWQLMMMGIGTYGFTVGIPSPLKLGQWDRVRNYYGAPWETMADLLGGVNGRSHSNKEIWNAWGYYAVSTLVFPLAGLYWL